MSKQIFITTRTVIINTIVIPEEEADGMTDDEIKEEFELDPEAFGRDDDPYFEEADKILSIVREDDDIKILLKRLLDELNDGKENKQ